MAENKSKQEKAANDPEAGVKEVEEKLQKEQEQGFAGVEVDPIPNERYSLETDGQDSPTIAEQEKALAEKLADEDRHPTGNAI